MKITNLNLYLVRPRWCFLEMETDEGITGWGEPVLEGHCDAVKACVEEMKPYLIGHDPSRIEDIWSTIYRAGFYRGGGVLMSAIAGIDQQQYEAAKVDGAGYFRCAWHVTVPAMMETYVVLFILNVGNFLNTGYEQYMLFKNSVTAPAIEVLDLYVYRIGLENMDYSYGVAISIVKSIVSVALVVIANMVAKKIRGNTVI